MPSPADIHRQLQSTVAATAARAHVPYSNVPRGCILLLSDGTLIPGVRVESASFSLTIHEAVNAFSTAAALARHDIAAIVTSHDLLDADIAFLAHTFAGRFEPAGAQIAVAAGADLPEPGAILDPVLEVEPGDKSLLEATRRLGDRAVVPASGFPVSCIAVGDNGRAIPGVNVEHDDWSRIICAERNALGTLVSYGLGALCSLYLSCPRDSGCTPCGACRQLLAELAPDAVIMMDRGSIAAERTTPADLLPHFFSGRAVNDRR